MVIMIIKFADNMIKNLEYWKNINGDYSAYLNSLSAESREKGMYFRESFFNNIPFSQIQSYINEIRRMRNRLLEYESNSQPMVLLIDNEAIRSELPELLSSSFASYKFFRQNFYQEYLQGKPLPNLMSLRNLMQNFVYLVNEIEIHISIPPEYIHKE